MKPSGIYFSQIDIIREREILRKKENRDIAIFCVLIALISVVILVSVLKSV